jgi:hypothetical protein
MLILLNEYPSRDQALQPRGVVQPHGPAKADGALLHPDRPYGSARRRNQGGVLQQLVEIKRLTQAGVNLERIREVLEGAKAPVTSRTLSPGDVTVKSHVHVSHGVDLLIDPHAAGLSAQEVRQLIQTVVAAMGQIKQPSNKNSEET